MRFGFEKERAAELHSGQLNEKNHIYFLGCSLVSLSCIIPVLLNKPEVNE